MRDWSKVSPAIWSSKRFLSLASSDARLVHMYFLTSGHQNSIGCYRLPDGYAAADLGWEVERYRTAREMVLNSQLIDYDYDTEEILVFNWLKFNPPMNPKHEIGNQGQLDRVRSERLAEQLLQNWVQFVPKEPERNAATKVPISKQLQESNLLSRNFR